MSKSVRAQLRLVRQQLHLTQKALAEKLNVPLRTLIGWENDQASPRGLALEALTAKLDALLKGSD